MYRYRDPLSLLRPGVVLGGLAAWSLRPLSAETLPAALSGRMPLSFVAAFLAPVLSHGAARFAIAGLCLSLLGLMATSAIRGRIAARAAIAVVLPVLIVSLGILIAACGSAGTYNPQQPNYTLSFTVSGLTSGTVTVTDTDEIDIHQTSGNTSTPITLETLNTGTQYNIQLASPSQQKCSVPSGSASGTMGSSNVTLAITCSAAADYSVGVTVSGLNTGTVTVTDTANGNAQVSTGNTTTAAIVDAGLAAGTSYSLTLTQPTGATCAFSNSTTGGTTVSGSISSSAPANVVQPIVCTPTTYGITYTVSGLSSGTAVTIEDNTDSVSASSGNTTTAGTLETLGYGKAYSIALTSPSGQTCTITAGTASGTITAVVTLTITCSSGYTPVSLSGPGGMAFDSTGKLYVTNNSGSTGQVLIYSISGQSTGQPVLTQVGDITTGINQPSRVAFDTTGTYLFVANIGANNITVYNPSSSLTTVVTTIGSVSRPLGLAVDQSGNVYAGNNSANTISIYSQLGSSPSGGYSTTPVTLSHDNSGNQFSAPGALMFSTFAGQYNGILVGLGPSGSANQVLLYQTPMSVTSAPTGMLTNSSCSTGPSGPTGIAVKPNSPPVSALIYVTNYYNSNAIAYPLQGSSSIMTSSSGCPTPAFQSGSSSAIQQPEGIAVDAFSNIYISNSGNSTITVYSSITGAPYGTYH